MGTVGSPTHRVNYTPFLEETLASAHVFKHAGTVNPKLIRQTNRLVAAWMQHQPPRCRDFTQVSKHGQTGSTRSQFLPEIIGVLRGSTTFVLGFEAPIRQPSFKETPGRARFSVKPEST